MDRVSRVRVTVMVRVSVYCRK